MAVVTHSSTTMINSAFLQEVKESNVELWETVRQLRELVELGCGCEHSETRVTNERHPGMHCTAGHARRLVALLGQLRDHLAFEFTLEEAYGFIEGCRGIAPLLAQKASTAKQQHRELYLLIHELCESAEEAQYRGVADRDFLELLSLAADFEAQLQAHEQLESELITCGCGLVS